jgi:excisionase family DNA binding protein
MPIERRWLRVREAAEYMGLHPASVYRACARKRLPCAKVPGVGLRVDKLALDAMLERGEIRPGEVRLNP